MLKATLLAVAKAMSIKPLTFDDYSSIALSICDMAVTVILMLFFIDMTLDVLRAHFCSRALLFVSA